MAKTRAKKSDLEKQLSEIKAQIATAKLAEEAEFGRLARKAGLLDLELTSVEMTDILKMAIDTFRKSGKTSTAQAAQTGIEA